jgi:hypothetical protein
MSGFVRCRDCNTRYRDDDVNNLTCMCGGDVDVITCKFCGEDSNGQECCSKACAKAPVSDSDVTMTCLNGVTLPSCPKNYSARSPCLAAARKAAPQELEDAQPRIEGEGKPSPAIREGR